jgi:hypothetical protein
MANRKMMEQERKKSLEPLVVKSATAVKRHEIYRETEDLSIGLGSKPVSEGRSLTSILNCWGKWGTCPLNKQECTEKG